MCGARYKRGRAFEYRVKKKLEREGYYVVRSAGSHSVADLVAVRKKVGRTAVTIPLAEVLFVQCFRGRKSARELVKLVEVCEDYGAIPCVATVRGRTLLFLKSWTQIAASLKSGSISLK
jgi:Holliday junction resolvase